MNSKTSCIWVDSLRPAVLLVASVVVALSVGAGSAVAYDAAADFSTNTNPNGVWSYGWSTNLGSSLQLYTTPALNAGFNIWTYTNLYPYVAHNGTTNTITVANAHQVLQAGQMAAHPGANGEYSIVRWTAPLAGSYSIAASFAGADQDGDSADVHVLDNSTSIFNGDVFGFGTPTSFSTNLVLGAGDTIDFAVGYGSDRSYYDDLTAMSAVVIPEPTTFALAAAGLACAVAFGSRRRKWFSVG